MKKFIFLVLLLSSFASYSQLEGMVITNIIPVESSAYNTTSKTLTVPAGKIWVLQDGFRTDRDFLFKPNGITYYSSAFAISRSFSNPFFLTPGTSIYFTAGGVVNILEYNVPTNQTGVLALNEIKSIENKIELFPNPTNSRITLNSEKDYKIEIYNMEGQMVMRANGNSIDMSSLSNSVYILKAYDNYKKTTETFKVVKN